MAGMGGARSRVNWYAYNFADGNDLIIRIRDENRTCFCGGKTHSGRAAIDQTNLNNH